MDISPQSTTQPISDDQELAKALAGVLDEPMPESTAATEPAPVTELSFEEAPAPAPTAVTDVPAVSTAAAPVAPVVPAAPVAPASGSADLAALKQTALTELRPLMDKVELPAEEKFNTYLMLIRSTDDATLVGPAHQAALAISDEKARATALLEIIKEIDYLSSPDKTAA